MKAPIRPLVGACLTVFALACGNRPAEVVPPIGKAELVDPSAELPRVRFADGSISANDRCPVTKRKLSVSFPPVYVNGMAIGFC